MENILSTPQPDSAIKNRMPRRKVFETNINLPITNAQLARIAAVLHVEVGEARVSFIRHAIEKELRHRERELNKRSKRRKGT